MKCLPLALCLLVAAPCCLSATESTVMDERAKDSYSLGYEFGQNLKRQHIDIDAEVLLAAITDGLNGKAPLLDRAEMRGNLLELRKKIFINQDKHVREFSAKNLSESMAFLEQNRSKEGVTTLPSGLQYRIVRQGSGPRPDADDAVTVHFRGTLSDGREFDSSRTRDEAPTINVNGVIKGWTEALKLMPAGSVWQLFIPPELGYGSRQFGRIPPNSALVFELELLSVAAKQHAADPTRATPVEQ